MTCPHRCFTAAALLMQMEEEGERQTPLCPRTRVQSTWAALLPERDRGDLASSHPFSPSWSSLSQPVVVGGEAPPAVPLIQHHQPAVDRLEELQGLALGILCGANRRVTHGADQNQGSSEDSLLSPPIIIIKSHQGLHFLHSGFYMQLMELKGTLGMFQVSAGPEYRLGQNHSCCLPLVCHPKDLLI